MTDPMFMFAAGALFGFIVGAAVIGIVALGFAHGVRRARDD